MKQSTVGRIIIISMGAFSAFSFGVGNGLAGVAFIAGCFLGIAYTSECLSKEDHLSR